MASFIGIRLVILYHKKEFKYMRILAITDNLSVLDWLYKASFNPVTQEIHTTIARKLAHKMMTN